MLVKGPCRVIMKKESDFGFKNAPKGTSEHSQEQATLEKLQGQVTAILMGNK